MISTGRLGPDYHPASYRGLEAQTGPLPRLSALRSPMPRAGSYPGFEVAFLIRMLFSCLVDAYSLETEPFYAEANGVPVEPGGHARLDPLRDRLRAHMAALREKAERAAPSQLNALRARVLDHAVGKAALSFALEHAARHHLRRIVYVIPFTSIVEQTAQVFREALGAGAEILEHHASFDWERATADLRRIDDEGGDALRKLRRAAENWDLPIVVTTAVQFFESLFSNKRSRCRKLHNLAGSVIILDEAQTLPVPLLLPCLAAIGELARNYRASIVLCTATQPAVRKQDQAIFDNRQQMLGLDIPDKREFAPERGSKLCSSRIPTSSRLSLHMRERGSKRRSCLRATRRSGVAPVRERGSKQHR